MKWNTAIIWGFFLVPIITAAQIEARSPRIANYDIQLELDVEQRRVNAKETLFWKNPSGDTIRELQFHLYYNAFKNSQSTFLSERGIPSVFRKSLVEDCGWGWVDVNTMEDQYGNNLAEGMEYIQPDDDNIHDQTVLSVPLPKPVLPYDSIRINLTWQSQIPKTVIRTGYNKDYFFMAQWFPKVGVYEPAGMRFATEGQWNCHQYHSSGEYYSDFGIYNVSISLPAQFKVGASGMLQSETINGATKTVVYKAEDVIDFTWTASPHFVEIKEEWKGVQLKLLTYPDHVYMKDRFLTTLKQSMDYMEEHFEKYPYPGLTLVDPPIHGLFSSAMEYPTLITTASLCFLPEGVKTPEILIAHEFVHQYFMQLVASNEQEEAWMDEGITNYYEGRIMDKFYGAKTSTLDIMGIQFGNIESNRTTYIGMDNPKIAENSRFSFEFTEGGYHSISYNKSAVWLHTLDGLVGAKTMDEIMKTYYIRWKFKHPCTTDFIAVVNEVVQKNHGDKFGPSMDWFFEQVLYGTETCDYKLATITNEPMTGPIGNLDTDEKCKQVGGDIGAFDCSVVLHRLGELKFPVDVIINFEDGTTIAERWDGQDRSITYNYISESKITQAAIDPMHRIYMDTNFINNSLRVEAEKTGIWKTLERALFWMQNTMQTLSALI